MNSGVARKQITDWEAYTEELRRRMGSNDNIMRALTQKAKLNPKRIVFAEGEDTKILKAAQILTDEGIAVPVLLGNVEQIRSIAQENQIDITGIEIIDPRDNTHAEQRNRYIDLFFGKRGRRGYNFYEAQVAMHTRNYYGTMMVECGDADALITGISRQYATSIRPALEIIGTYEKGKKVATMYLMLTKRGPIFFSDTTMIAKPTSEELVDITLLTAQAVKKGFNIEPKVALLSYSNFGSSDDEEPRTVRKAVEKLKAEHPELIVDGEIQANIAFNREILAENYPFSELVHNEPNILIFPNLSSANIAYKLLQTMNAAEAIGPIVLGMRKPVHILQMGCSVREVVNMAVIACVDAQSR